MKHTTSVRFIRLRFIFGLLLFGPLAAAAAAPTAAELAELFLPYEFSRPALSPDGAYLAFIARRGDNYAVGVYNFATRKMSYSGGDKIIPVSVWWMEKHRLLIRSTNYKHETISFAGLNVDTDKMEDLWKMDDKRGEIVDGLPDDPRHIMMLGHGDLMRVDVQSGNEEVVTQQIAHARQWVIDDHARARGAIEHHADFGTFDLWWRAAPDGAWQTRTFTEKENRFYAQAVMTDQRYLLGWQLTPDLDLAIARMNTADGAVEALHPIPGLEPTRFLVVGRTRRPIAVGYDQSDTARLAALDPVDAPGIERLEKHFAGYSVDIIDTMPDGKNWLLWVGNSQLPGAYILFNHETSEASVVEFAQHGKALAEEQLTPAEYFTFPLRGGGLLPARLWRPKDKPHPPLIVICPDRLPAPSVRDAFHSTAQAWVKLGFAVLEANGRNSWGFGNAGRQLAPEQWLPALQEDLEDAVQHLVAKKIVDPSHIHLFGREFGGVLALQVAMRSKVFTSVATLNVPDKLYREDMYRITFEPGINPLTTKLGGWWESGKFASSLSPVLAAPQLELPALYLANEDSIKGRPVEDGRVIRDAAKKAKAPAQTELAYSWSQYPKLPMQEARESAEIAVKIARFFEQGPKTPAK